MKTSLLLVGLVMGVGMLGTTQAANAASSASNTLSSAHDQALVAASMSDASIFSALTDLLSGKSNQDVTTPPCGHDPHTTDNKAVPCQAQGQPPPTVMSAHPRAAADGMDPDAPRSTDSDNPAPSPASSVEPVLGWQSLLPGSIQ